MAAAGVSRLYRCGVCGLTAPDFDYLRSHMLAEHLPAAIDEETSPALSESDNAAASYLAGSPVVDFTVPTNSTIPSMAPSMAPSAAPSTATTTHNTVSEHEVDLNFKVKIPSFDMPLFPKHIKPTLSFTCSYCDFKDCSFKNVSIHLLECHPKKLDVRLRSRSRPPELNSADVSLVDNSAYIKDKKLRKGRTVLLKRDGSIAQIQSRARKRLRRDFSCAECNAKCESQTILEIHKRCHTPGSNRLRCCFCHKDAPSAKAWYGLYIHMVNKHPDRVPAPIYCKTCQKGFVKESDLHLHMKSHSDEKSFICEVCGDSFKFKTNLEHHGILKHGLGTEEQRQKLMARRRSRLMLSSRDDVPWLYCQLCHYKTKVNYKLKIHSKVHEGIKDIACPHCSYKTGDTSSLKRHLWRHVEAKPYSCRFCEFTAIQRAQMQSHYKNKHSIPPQDSKPLIQHVNGRRTGIYSDLDTAAVDLANANTYIVEHTADHGELTSTGTYVIDQGGDNKLETMEVVSGDAIPHDENTITIQVVNSEHPVDLGLLTEAAEGLLAASQIELHTTE